MTDRIAFDLVSPERLLLSEAAEMVTIPGAEGYIGVMAGHAPVITTLKAGVIDVKGGDRGDQRFFVSSGFAEITGTKISVLAEEALPLADLDASAIESRIRDAEEDILQAKNEAERARAVQAVDNLKLLRASL